MSEARRAATVIVLRPSEHGPPEILMVRRARGQSFMADAFVFPGGRVDDADGREDPFRVAAARELREEASVVVEARDLVPLSRWITPSAEPKRFDARFFVVAVDASTEATVDATEVTEILWASAKDVLARADLKLPPPTLHTLAELAEHVSIPDVLAWAHARGELAGEPIQPKLVTIDGALVILLPWDPAYPFSDGFGAAMDASHPLARGASRYGVRDGRFFARHTKGA